MAEDDRGPGRPPAEDRRKLGTVVFARVTEQEFDQLCQLAREQEQSLSAAVRRIIRERLKP